MKTLNTTFDKEVFWNAFFLILEKGLLTLTSFFVGVYVARYLGPQSYGKLNYSYSIVLLVVPIANLGLGQIVVKFLKSENRASDVVSSAFFLTCASSVFFFLIFNVIVWLSLTDDKLLYFTLSFIVLLQSFNVFDSYFQALLKSNRKVIAKSISTILSSLLKLYFIYAELGVIVFALVYVIDLFIYSVIIYWFYSRHAIARDLIRVKKEFFPRLLKESWPLLFSGFLITLYMKMDKVMIGLFLDEHAVGVYTVAARLSESWYFIGIAISQSIFPRLLDRYSQSNDKQNKEFSKIYSLMIYINIPVILFVLFFSDTIIKVIFDSSYIESANVLKVHFLSSIFVFIGLIGNKWLIINGLNNFSLVKSFCGFIINLVLNIFLIPRYGIIGAAWATLLSQIVASYLIFIFDKRLISNFILISKSFFFKS